MEWDLDRPLAPCGPCRVEAGWLYDAMRWFSVRDDVLGPKEL